MIPEDFLDKSTCNHSNQLNLSQRTRNNFTNMHGLFKKRTPRKEFSNIKNAASVPINNFRSAKYPRRIELKIPPYVKAMITYAMKKD